MIDRRCSCLSTHICNIDMHICIFETRVVLWSCCCLFPGRGRSTRILCGSSSGSLWQCQGSAYLVWSWKRFGVLGLRVQGIDFRHLAVEVTSISLAVFRGSSRTTCSLKQLSSCLLRRVRLWFQDSGPQQSRCSGAPLQAGFWGICMTLYTSQIRKQTSFLVRAHACWGMWRSWASSSKGTRHRIFPY